MRKKWNGPSVSVGPTTGWSIVRWNGSSSSNSKGLPTRRKRITRTWKKWRRNKRTHPEGTQRLVGRPGMGGESFVSSCRTEIGQGKGVTRVHEDFWHNHCVREDLFTILSHCIERNWWSSTCFVGLRGGDGSGKSICSRSWSYLSFRKTQNCRPWIMIHDHGPRWIKMS